MRWARDVVAEYRAVLTIRSVASLLTATTRVMVVGMDAALTATAVRETPSLDVAETAIGTLTISGGDAAIVTVISTTIDVGDAIGRHLRESDEAFLTPS